MKNFLFLSLCLASLVSLSLSLSPWVSLGPKASTRDSHNVQLTVALNNRNLSDLREIVSRVSDPASREYGKYLNLQQVRDLVAPPQKDIDQVIEYFNSIGAISVTETLSKDFLTVVIPSEALKEALGVKMEWFSHVVSGRLMFRSLDSFKLPEEIASKVHLITGINDWFDSPRERKDFARFVARKHAASSNSTTSAPEIARVNGGPSDLTALVNIYCKNGQKTTDVKTPCSDHPPTVSSLQVTIKPRGHTKLVVSNTFPGDSNEEFVCKMYDGKYASCKVHSDIPTYRRANITAVTTFSDGSSSDTGSFPTPFSPSAYVTPQTIFKQYGVPLNTRGSHPDNSQAVTAFEEQYISLSDLERFFKSMGLENQTPIIHGKNDESKPGGESTLDIQYIMGTGPGINTTFWSVSGPVGNGGYILEWAKEVANTPKAPLVTSISYGDTELGYYNKFGSWEYINRMNDELAKMAARGLTVIAGSGDAGASNVGEAGNDLSPTDPSCSPSRPFFPSNSPYATSVSSTFLTPNWLGVCAEDQEQTGRPIQCDQVGEVAVSVSSGMPWTTGGGFSRIRPTQSWQQKQVKDYLTKYSDLLPSSSYFNATGRGYPDVSTVGHNLIMNIGGVYSRVDGTSASGPVLAGLISLINDKRLHQKKSPLGFISPWLYSLQQENPAAFVDITVGKNFDGDIQERGSPFPTFCSEGFWVTPGWDPVVGLGTPNFPAWVESALSLP